MPVAVMQAPEKKDPLDTVLKGLQIAGSVYGIREASAKLEEIEAQKQQREDTSAGVIAPKDEAALVEKGFLRVPEAGSNTVAMKRPDGSPVFFQPPKPKSELNVPKFETYRDAKGNNRIGKVGPEGLIMSASDPLSGTQPASEKPPKDISVSERNTLQNQYDRDPQTRKNREVFQSYNDSVELAKENSPAADQSLIYSYMKALDPGSVVRETEAETAAAMGGLQERAKAYYLKNAGESGLSDAQRADILKQIKAKSISAASAQKAIDNQFANLAKRRNVSTEDLRFANYPSLEGGSDALAAGGPAGPTREEALAELKARGALPKDPPIKNNFNIDLESPEAQSAAMKQLNSRGARQVSK